MARLDDLENDANLLGTPVEWEELTVGLRCKVVDAPKLRRELLPFFEDNLAELSLIMMEPFGSPLAASGFRMARH